MHLRAFLTATASLIPALLPALVLAAAPPPPPGCSGRQLTRTNSADVPIPDNGTATSPLTVAAGEGRIVWDVDVRTSITHASNAQLDLALISPSGARVVLTTDNGSIYDNGFNGTRFDDAAPTPVTDATFPADGAVEHVAPEGALSFFRGQDPNGTWTLELTDDLTNTTGTLTSWSLDLVTLPAAAPIQTSTASDTATVALADKGTVTSTLEVSAPGDFLTGITVMTKLRHTRASDLEVMLTSPSGTTIVLTTDNGGANDDVFNGTLWTDAAMTPVSDATYADTVVQTELQPEGALAAFHGENPNGAWVLTVTDDLTNELGTLEGWTLNLETATGAACVSGGLTVSTVSPAQGPAAGGTLVTVTGTNFAPGATVLFDGVAGTNPEITANSASATTPPRPVGRVEVSVRNPDGEYASRADGFHFITAAPPPVLESLSPASGSTRGGTALTLNVRQLIEGAELKIGSAAPVPLALADPTTAVATSAPSTYGTFDVVVTNPDGQSSTLPSGFTYVAPAPKLTDVDPNLGSTAGGTKVSLRGEGFLEGVEVRFGGEPASVELIDEQLLEVVAPAHAAGLVDVVITNPDGQTLTRTRAFTYEALPDENGAIGGAGGCGCGVGSGAALPFWTLGLLALAGLRRRRH